MLLQTIYRMSCDVLSRMHVYFGYGTRVLKCVLTHFHMFDFKGYELKFVWSPIGRVSMSETCLRDTRSVRAS